MVILLMGVSGSGKTTIGRLLADALGWPFFDGDEFHPPANVAKMAAGIPLNDADRKPWLAILRAKIESLAVSGQSGVVACSALKSAYRDQLIGAAGLGSPVRLVYLKGSPDVIGRRLAKRRGHFMPPGLLASQFQTLEEPEGAVTVNIDQPPEQQVAAIRQAAGV